jgi:Domain of Unknown Function (DUF748)
MLKLPSSIRRTLLVILVLLIALPWLMSDIARYVVVDQLTQRGIDSVEVEEFWLNPYSAQLELAGVVFHHGQHSYRLSSLQLTLSWRDLWAKRIRISEFKLSGLDLHLQQIKDQFVINGLNLTAEAEAQTAVPEPSPSEDKSTINQWHFAIDHLSVDGVKLQWSGEHSAAKAQLNHLTLTALDSQSTAESELQFSLLVDELALPEKNLRAATEVHYTALIELQRDIEGVWSSLLLGNLTVDNTRVFSDEFSLNLSRLEAGLSTQASLADHFSHSTQAEINFSDTSLLAADNEAFLLGFNSLSFGARWREKAVEVDNLVLAGVNILPRSTIESASSEVKEESAFIESANIYLDHLDVNLASELEPLSVTVDQLTLAIADIYLDRSDDGSLVQMARIERLQERVDRMLKSLESDADQQSLLNIDHPKLATNNTENSLLTNDKKNARFRLERLTVESEVSLHFKDASVRPHFSEEFNVDFIDIENISLNEPLSMALKIDLSHGASLSASADASIFERNAQGKLELKGYELLAASAYSEIFTGYALESGQFSLASEFSIQRDLLSSQHHIDIDQLSLRAEHQDSMTKLTHQLTMPLDQAVDLLRDGENHIHLEVPVTGELNNPDVDLQQVINTALKGAMKKASLTMLTTLLQPYGAMISIAQMAGEEMTKVRLEPVVFSQGQASIDVASIDYVNKVGAMIKARPSLKIKLCAMTNVEDLNFLKAQSSAAVKRSAEVEVSAAQQPLNDDVFREKLQQLGLNRARSLKDYLQSEIGIESSQLLMCLPKHLSSSVSGVALSI